MIKQESSFVNVYIAGLPEALPVGKISCAERMNEINSVSNERVKREKYFVWKLLCYALEDSIGASETDLIFKKEDCGCWSVENAEISLAHSGRALAVAVSSLPVGVDIELLHTPKASRFAEHIMTKSEFSDFEMLPKEEKEKHLIEVWTAKEAIFKSRKLSAFSPKDTDTMTETFKTNAFELDGEEYVWTVATEISDRVRVFENIDLEKLL